MELPEECSVFQSGDYVKHIGGSFKGYFAVMTGQAMVMSWEINDFEKKGKWWTLKGNDLDSRDIDDLRKVTKVRMDHRSHYYFGE